MKGIDNILKPLYDLWHKVMDKLSVKNNNVEIDGGINVKGDILVNGEPLPTGGGTKLYKHSLVSKTASGDKCTIVSTSSTQANLSDVNLISVNDIQKTAVTRCCLSLIGVLSSGFYVAYVTFTQSGVSYNIALGTHLSLNDSTKWDDTVTEL